MRHELFPTPVWHIEGTPQVLVDELYHGAYHFKERYPSENRSNQGGYQSPNFSWNDFHPQSKEYLDEIIIQQKIDKLGEDNNTETSHTILTWWYNINPTGAWNAPHTHPECDLALVWYLTPSDGLLTLVNPRSFIHTADAKIKANKGDIVMFPSDILHYVIPNPRKEDRISISMNLQLC